MADISMYIKKKKEAKAIKTKIGKVLFKELKENRKQKK